MTTTFGEEQFNATVWITTWCGRSEEWCRAAVIVGARLSYLQQRRVHRGDVTELINNRLIQKVPAAICRRSSHARSPTDRRNAIICRVCAWQASVRRLPSAKWPSRPHINKERRGEKSWPGGRDGVKQWPGSQTDRRTVGRTDARNWLASRQPACVMNGQRCRPAGLLQRPPRWLLISSCGLASLASLLTLAAFLSAITALCYTAKISGFATVAELTSGHWPRQRSYIQYYDTRIPMTGIDAEHRNKARRSAPDDFKRSNVWKTIIISFHLPSMLLAKRVAKFEFKCNLSLIFVVDVDIFDLCFCMPDTAFRWIWIFKEQWRLNWHCCFCIFLHCNLWIDSTLS